MYALAIVIVRRFYERLQDGKWEITSHVRRISEELIGLGGTVSPTVLAATVCRPAHDDAERTVSAALLALAMAQQLTQDQRLLRWLATGALLCEVGKARVAGTIDADGSERVRRVAILGVGQYAELPAATAFVTTALGKLTDAGMMRSVVVYEALHIEHAEETAALYDEERGPAMLSRLLAVARVFQFRLSKGSAAADVIADLVGNAATEVDRWIVQLLMATLNILPTGTIVELNDGHQARVVSPPLDRIDFGRPLVRLLSQNGRPVDSRYLDLNLPVGMELPPQITKIVAAVDAVLDDDAAEVEVTDHGNLRGANESAASDDLDWSLGEEPRGAPTTGVRRSHGSDAGLAANVAVSDGAPDSRVEAGLEEAVFEQIELAPLAPKGAPTARGTLAKTPLVHLLVYAADNRLTGTLLLLGEGRRSAIYFRDGFPCKTQVPETDVGEVGERGAMQRIVGEIGQMMQLAEGTTYGFFVDINMLAIQFEGHGVACDPLPLIMMGARKYLDYDVLDRVLPKVANIPLVLHDRAKAARLGLKPAERELLLLIRDKEMSLNDLLSIDGVDEDIAQRTVYALTVTRLLAIGTDRRLPVAH